MTPVFRLVLRHVLVGILGAGAIWAQFVYRVPSRFAAVALVLVCVVLSVLHLVLIAAVIGRWGTSASPWRRTAASMERATSVLVLLFGFYGMFLLFNGILDQARPTPQRSELLAIRRSETDFLENVPFVWADLAPWRPGRPVERVLMLPFEREILWSAGQRIVVSEHPGYFGVPWISLIEIDEEWRARRILEARPTATRPWLELAAFHVRHHRLPQAREAALEYLRRRPRDFTFALWMAKVFFESQRYAEIVDVLEPIVHHHEDRDTYLLYGTALSRVGRAPEGIRWLETSLKIDAEFWFTYYLIGIAWTYANDYRAAIPKFEEALRRGNGWDMSEVEYSLKVARDTARNQAAHPTPPAR